MYLLVEAPYEQCFELFFKTELGYPNFYRVSELFLQEGSLTLIAPQDLASTKRVEERAHLLGITYLIFGEGIKTTFAFDKTGTLQTSAHFLEALQKAMLVFQGRGAAPPPAATTAAGGC